MNLSIIIHNYNTKNFLKQCLAQLLKMPIGVDYEIIVIDSNSHDGSVEMMKQFYPSIKLIASSENLGFQKGNNAGIKEAVGKYLLILNTDLVFIDENATKKMFDYLEENKNVALLGPQLLNPDKTVQRSVMRFHKWYTPFCRRTFISQTSWGQKELERFEMDDLDQHKNSDVDWVFGGCMMVRRSAIDIVGMMNEDLFLYFGDTDWAREFWRNGWQVHYLSEAKVVHMHRRESADASVLKYIFAPAVRAHILDWIVYLKKWGLGSRRPKIVCLHGN
jgi:GT2 family glycosyltransferase